MICVSTEPFWLLYGLYPGGSKGDSQALVMRLLAVGLVSGGLDRWWQWRCWKGLASAHICLEGGAA